MYLPASTTHSNLSWTIEPVHTATASPVPLHTLFIRYDLRCVTRFVAIVHVPLLVNTRRRNSSPFIITFRRTQYLYLCSHQKYSKKKTKIRSKRRRRFTKDFKISKKLWRNSGMRYAHTISRFICLFVCCTKNDGVDEFIPPPFQWINSFII